jgi:hypothetical protein
LDFGKLSQAGYSEGVDDEAVEKICRIPVEYKRLGNVSFDTLLKESGYMGQDLDVEQIKKILIRFPELIEPWLVLSLDQRGGPSWYVLSPEDSKSKKWTFSSSPKSEPEQYFSDGPSAVAKFIAAYVNKKKSG